MCLAWIVDVQIGKKLRTMTPQKGSRRSFCVFRKFYVIQTPFYFYESHISFSHQLRIYLWNLSDYQKYMHIRNAFLWKPKCDLNIMCFYFYSYDGHDVRVFFLFLFLCTPHAALLTAISTALKHELQTTHPPSFIQIRVHVT